MGPNNVITDDKTKNHFSMQPITIKTSGVEHDIIKIYNIILIFYDIWNQINFLIYINISSFKTINLLLSKCKDKEND